MYQNEINEIWFYKFEEKKPKSGDIISVQTTNFEVIDILYIEGNEDFECTDFEGLIELSEIKGWNYPDCL